MYVNKQLKVATDFYTMGKKILWRSMATVNCLVNNIIENIFFCLIWLVSEGETIPLILNSTINNTF